MRKLLLGIGVLVGLFLYWRVFFYLDHKINSGIEQCVKDFYTEISPRVNIKVVGDENKIMRDIKIERVVNSTFISTKIQKSEINSTDENGISKFESVNISSAIIPGAIDKFKLERKLYHPTLEGGAPFVSFINETRLNIWPPQGYSIALSTDSFFIMRSFWLDKKNTGIEVWPQSDSNVITLHFSKRKEPLDYTVHLTKKR